jgi:hypothetical protein
MRVNKGGGGASAGNGPSHRNTGGASWLDGQVSPSFLLFWGLILTPSVVLQDHLWLKAAQAAILVLLALAAGRVRFPGALLGSFLFVVATVVINLLSPLGRLLVRLGPLRVTSGALTAGLRKALTVLALAYLSRLCVREDLRLPGPAGRYLRLTFGYLNALLVRRWAIVGRDLIGRIDNALEVVCRQEQEEQGGTSRANRTTPVGVAFMTGVAALMWFSALCRI